MRPLDPRLLRRAAGVRSLLVVSVLLGLAAALATIGQAVLLAEVLARVIIGGATRAQVVPALAELSVVVLIRAGIAWAAEEYSIIPSKNLIVKLTLCRSEKCTIKKTTCKAVRVLKAFLYYIDRHRRSHMR